MKILFIHEVNYETKVIFEMHEFPELLAKLGHKVDFLHFPEDTGIGNWSIRPKQKEISGRVYADSKINLITPANFGGSFIDRVVSTLTVIPLLFTLISKRKYDVVVLYSVPTSGWQATIIARIKKVPIVYRAIDVSHLLRSGLTKNLVKMAEKIVYRNANIISANNPALAQYCSVINKRKVKTSIDYPPLDFSHFSNIKSKEIDRKKYNLEDSDFVLCFMGTFYKFSGLDEVIEQLDSSKYKNFKLLLVGGGELHQDLVDLVKKKNLNDRVVFTGIVDYQELPGILRLSDVVFNSFKSDTVSNLALPHKVLQYLALGLPTISTKLDGLYQALKEDAGVFWVNSPSEVLEKALEIKSITLTEVERRLLTGKNFISMNFSIDKSVDKFQETLVKVTR